MAVVWGECVDLVNSVGTQTTGMLNPCSDMVGNFSTNMEQGMYMYTFLIRDQLDSLPLIEERPWYKIAGTRNVQYNTIVM